VCAVQGLWLKRRATRLPGAAGPRQGRCGRGPGSPLRLLALGDSIIDGVGAEHMERALPAQFAGELAARLGRPVDWWADGLSGRDLAALLGRLDDPALPARVDLLLLSVGVNDVTGLSTTRRWRSGLARLLERIDTRWPDAAILFAGLPPMAQFPLPPQPLRWSLGLRAATLDRIAAAILEDHPRAVHVPTRIDRARHRFSPDGFHPSAESCTLWARELAKLAAGRNAT